jgi:hypothetical protein
MRRVALITIIIALCAPFAVSQSADTKAVKLNPFGCRTDLTQESSDKHRRSVRNNFS